VVALVVAGAAAMAGLAGDGLRNRAPKHSPPVLGLVWHTVDPDLEPWAGLGLAELVRAALSARGVVVRPSPESLGAGRAADAKGLAALGRRLEVTYTLGGTVGRSDHRSEIGMRLVRVSDGLEVWSSTFWRDRRDLESLPGELATAVSEVLRAESRLGNQR
jgi:TolB-like protein